MGGNAVLKGDCRLALKGGFGSEVIDGENAASVGFESGVAHNPYGQRRRRDFDLTINLLDVQLVGNIGTGSIADDQLVGGRRDRVGRDVSGRGARGSGLNPVTSRQTLHGNGCPVRLAVVEELAAHRGHDDLLGVLGHRQRAKILLDRIVGLLGAAVPVYRVRVRGAFGRIDLGGRASGGESGGLVVHQTSHLTGGRERGTVVGLGGSTRLHVQLGRLDDNRALLLLDDVKLVRHIDAGLVDDAQRVDLRHHGLFGHIGRAGVRGSCYQRIAFRQTANAHRRSMGIPVVGILAAFGSRNDLALELFHGQRARLVSNIVIARHVLRPARNDGLENGRFDRAGIGDGAEQIDSN